MSFEQKMINDNGYEFKGSYGDNILVFTKKSSSNIFCRKEKTSPEIMVSFHYEFDNEIASISTSGENNSGENVTVFLGNIDKDSFLCKIPHYEYKIIKLWEASNV